jgi:predicted molibdopterin-dependent oxidoreductase YjgC
MLTSGSPVKGMLIAGADPAIESETYKTALSGLDFLIVQDLFLTETAKLADVVLPARAVAERDGTFTNVARRVQAFDSGIDSPMLARSDWMIVTAIAGQLGAEWEYASADGVMADITAQVSLYKGMTFENLVAPVSLDRQTSHYIYEGMSFTADVREGAQWSTVAEDDNRKFELRFIKPADAPTSQGMTLVAPRMLYDGGRLLAESEVVEGHIIRPQVLLSPADAKKLGVADGSMVTISQNGTSVELTARINRVLNEGTVVVPRNLEGRPAEKLVGAGGVSAPVEVK